MARQRLVAAVLLALVALSPGLARAQYKNASFGFDGGFWLIQKPAIPDGALTSVNKRPLRLSTGGRLGGETNFKLDQDHWWFTGRVNVGFLTFSGEEDFDRQAQEALGTLFGIQGSIGIRYVILTDKLRPYLQLSLSYLRLFSFASLSGENCSAGDDFTYCDSGTYDAAFMPHPNVGGLHLQPGVELIISRDFALHFFADVQHWIVFGAPDNNAVVLGIGVLWFT
jgi:hypothetical protein